MAPRSHREITPLLAATLASVSLAACVPSYEPSIYQAYAALPEYLLYDDPGESDPTSFGGGGPALLLASTDSLLQGHSEPIGDEKPLDPPLAPQPVDRKRLPDEPMSGARPLQPGELPAALLRAIPATNRHNGRWRIGQILIENRGVFEKAANAIYSFLNFLHAPTRKEVIVSEILTNTGELYDVDKVEESARNLRKLEYLADAEILPMPRLDGTVDLHVRSRDRFTLRMGADVKYVGGVLRYSATVGESNLFGRGKQLRASYSLEDDHEVLRGVYEDSRLFGSRWAMRLEHAQSEVGGESVFSLARPFFSAATPWALEAQVKRQDSNVAFYAGGQLAAEVPRALDRVTLSAAISNGRRRDTRRLHLDLESAQTTYQTAILHDPAFAVEVPGSTETFQARLRASVTRHSRYLKIRGLDGLDHVEDVPLGWTGELGAGIALRTEQDQPTEHPATLAGTVFGIFRPHNQHLTSIKLSAEAHVRGGDVPRLIGSAFVHHYYRGLKGQVLALSVAGSTAFEGRDLPLQLTLGEDNGLRGYPARTMAGRHRFRINIEDRIRTPLELFSYRVGVVAFLDAGMAGDGDSAPSLSELRTSVGVGLRFGSARLSGKKIGRLDLALPLDGDEQARPTVSLSVSMGQVFSLFHNAEELQRDL